MITGKEKTLEDFAPAMKIQLRVNRAFNGAYLIEKARIYNDFLMYELCEYE